MAEMSLPPVWILLGPEIGKKQTFVSDIVAKARALGGDEPDYHKLYAGDSTAFEVLSLLQNASLFSSWVIVEYRNVDQVSQKSEIDALAHYCLAPSEHTVLFLETEGYSVAKPIEKIVPSECRKTFYEMFENEFEGWIRRELSASGLSIDDDALETLLELVPHDTLSMRAAILILNSNFARGSALSTAEIEAAILRSKPEDAFTIFEKISQGQLEIALESLDSVLDARRGDANQIIAALVWSFRRLARIADAISQGERFEDVCLREQARSKAVQRNLRAALQRYTSKDCRTIILALSETEAAIRGPLGSPFERQLLQLLITFIITEKGRGLATASWSERGIYPQFKA
jgi:DNA polymerase III delta subunit